MNLSSMELVGQRLVLDRAGDHVIGPDALLRDCVVRIDCADSNLSIVRATFESCAVSISRRLHDVDFFSARFSNCSFEGDLRGLRFGRLPLDEDDPEDIDGFGGVENCSFAGAVLHLTDFMNVDMARVTLPRWPCFAILDPASRADLLELEWPGSLRLLVEVFVESDPECTAIVCHAPDVAAECGIEQSALRATLEGCRAFLL